MCRFWLIQSLLMIISGSTTFFSFMEIGRFNFYTDQSICLVGLAPFPLTCFVEQSMYVGSATVWVDAWTDILFNLSSSPIILYITLNSDLKPNNKQWSSGFHVKWRWHSISTHRTNHLVRHLCCGGNVLERDTRKNRGWTLSWTI